MKLSNELKVGQPVPQRVQRLFQLDYDHLKDWRDESRVCYDFVSGHQWSEDEIKDLQEQKRPVVTFNRTKTVIDAVTGSERSNRREVRYIPREMGDVRANELYTAAGEWFRDQAHADDHESDAFADQLISGLGYTETRLDFDEEEGGAPAIERIDPFEMCYDHKARQPNLTDARRFWRHRSTALEDARDLAGDYDGPSTDYDATWVTSPVEVADQSDSDESGEGGSDRSVTLVHVQWKERVTVFEVVDPATGQKAELSSAEYEKLNTRMKKLGLGALEGRKRSKMKRMQAVLGRVVLRVGEAPSQSGFSFNAITGFRDQTKGTFFGMVRTMVDPQTWANKWLSQTLHIMNVNAKGGLMAERGAFENQAQAEQSWSDPSKITWLNDGALGQNKIKEKTAVSMPAGFKDLTEFAVSSIRDVTGVSLEVLGMREANQAASLEYQRRQSGMTILQPLFDSLRHYREVQGRVMLDFIQNDLSDGRLIRIAGEGMEQYVPLTRQTDATYDIIVDDAPTSPNHKEMVWQLFMQMLPTLGAALPPDVMLKMMEYSPFPSALVKDIQKLAAQPNPEAQQQQAQAMQLAQAQAQAEVAKTQSEAVENRADAELTKAQTAKELVEAQQMQRAGEFANALSSGFQVQ